MTDDDRRLLRDWDDHLSPTLKDHYELVQALTRVPICVACPMAQCYVLESPALKPDTAPPPATLQCFCTAFRDVMYNGARVVTACDALKDAQDSRIDETYMGN